MKKYIYVLLFFFQFLGISLNAKTITGIEYYNPENDIAFRKNCLNDFQETQEKIFNNMMNVDLVTNWEINYIGLVCNIYNGKTDKIFDQLIFFIQSMKENNISDKNYPEIYEFFSVLISPFIESNYPELLDEINIDRNKINSQIEEEIEFLEIKAQVDKTSLSALHTILTFYIIELVNDKKFDKANLYLKKFVRNTEKQHYYRDYLYSYGPALLIISIEENKNNLEKEIYDYLEDTQFYFNQYDYDSLMLGNYLRGISELTKILFEKNKFKEIEKIENKYDILNLYSKIPKTDLTLLEQYANTLHTYSKRLGGNSYKTYYKQNYLKQLELSELAATIIVDDIINSKEIFLDQDSLKTLINDNDGKLYHFTYLEHYYYTYIVENKLDLDRNEYWRLFDKSFKTSQILSQNNLKDTIKNLFVKHNIKNPLVKELFDQKYEIEEEITNITNQKNDFSTLKEYKDLKLSLAKVNKKISYQNADELTFLSNTVSLFEIIGYLEEDQGILYFQKTKYDDYNFYLITKTSSRKMVIYHESDLLKNINKVLDYSRNISNYNTSYFPMEESFDIYNKLFLQMGVVNNNINNFVIVGDGNLSTFPYWLLLTENNKSFNKNNINNLSWFSKKHNYNVHLSITDFYLNAKNSVVRLGIQPDEQNNILKIFNSSLAEKNNLKVNDKIISVNNISISNSNELLKILNQINPNETKYFYLTIKRNNKIQKIKINLQEQNILNTLNDATLIKINKAKEYDFVGIGNPILSSADSKYDQEMIRGLFKDFETRGYVNVDKLQYFPELPETEKEIKEIQSNFKINKTKLFLREDATEENIKKANLSRVKYLVFASHALVSGELNDLKEPGIILTPTKGNKENEGLLLASEISNLNLINTDLVVLSACNTSASNIENSIPLSGLAKSFFLAGAKSLIVTGWSVESDSAAYLSSGIFRKAMSDKINFSLALQKTINEMIEKNYHPLMWGPFILIGDI